MQNSSLADALASCADPLRARQHHDAFVGANGEVDLRKLDAEGARVLTALWSGSQILGEWLVQHPNWLGQFLAVEGMKEPRRVRTLRDEIDRWLRPGLAEGDFTGVVNRLRQLQQRELMRIAARDLARLARTAEITRELSDLADVCLETVFRVCWEQITRRFGEPWEADPEGEWRRTRFCVLGMGKLGGQELNYSSDVDVLLVYSDEGSTFREAPRPGSQAGKGIGNHEFFRRLAEAFVAEVGRPREHGALYRIDLRLRPEGKAGPLARSLESYENYYSQWGQTWERMMLIKARPVAGDAGLGDEFLEMVQPFRFPRLSGPGVAEEMAGMKQRLEREVVRASDEDRNVKLGRGGIRDIEFVVQTRQVLHAGRQPFLMDRQTVPTLRKLATYEHLDPQESEALVAAYEFLRDVEHRLQMENHLQTHTIPTERRSRERLGRLMGFSTLAAFEKALEGHRRHVRGVYDRLMGPAARPADSTSDETTVSEFAANDASWKTRFENLLFRDPDKALRLAAAFIHGPGFGHVPARTEKAARRLLTRLLALCPSRDTLEARRAAAGPDGDPAARWLSDPDRVLARLDTFIAAYGTRSLLFDTWNAKPTLFDLLVLLFDRSEFLAGTVIRTPDLIDELEISGRLYESRKTERTLADLREGIRDEDQRLWIRRYHETEFTRLGLREILGLAPLEQNLVELTSLAEACLQYALETALRKHRFKSCPLAILGLGKLGGAELTYGSDLDVLFVADDKAENLPSLQRVAVTVMDLIRGKTERGVAFALDARLRPDGEKGLLVSPLRTCVEYYRSRAQLWELQALSRCRPVAGNPELGQRFAEHVACLTDFSRDDCPAVAHTPSWKQEIARMRQRIEKERTPAGKDHLAIKTGSGGLVDAEFLAQTFNLDHGWHEPNTLLALERARAAQWLAESDATQLIENYKRLRRIEATLRRWSYEGEIELPDDPAPQYRVAVRCGFATAEDFLAAVARYRVQVREVYRKVLPQA